MSILLPFNNQPDSVAVKTGSYSIPAGQYARVTVSLTAGAIGFVSGGALAVGTDTVEIASDSDFKTATFFVPTGTSLNVTSSAASASNTTGTVSGYSQINDSSTATFTIGGTTALSCEARASVSWRGGTTITTAPTLTVTGDVDARYIVELYNELT